MPTARQFARLLKRTARRVEQKAYAAGRRDERALAGLFLKGGGWDEAKHPRDHGKFSSGQGGDIAPAAGPSPQLTTDPPAPEPESGFDGCLLVPLWGDSGDAVKAFRAFVADGSTQDRELAAAKLRRAEREADQTGLLPVPAAQYVAGFFKNRKTTRDYADAKVLIHAVFTLQRRLAQLRGKKRVAGSVEQGAGRTP